MDYKVINNYIKSNFSKQPRVSDDYYSRVNTWYTWYEGDVEDFHKITRSNGDFSFVTKMRKLNMAQQVSHDWSSVLINEGFDVSITSSNAKDTEKTSIFVKGKRGTTGVLGSQNFSENIPLLVEKAYALGTGAIVINIKDIVVSQDGVIVDASKGKIEFNYLDCFSIIPLSCNNGVVTEACFVSEIVYHGENYLVYQVHELVDNCYVITNKVSDTKGNDVSLDIFGLVPTIKTNSPKPWFAIIKPAVVDTMDLNNPMGVSVFYKAIDAIKGCDEAYHYLTTEVKSGTRLMLMDRSLFLSRKKEDGGGSIVPQDEQQPFIKLTGNKNDTERDKLVKEITPDMRVEQYISNLQENLNLLSLKTGLGVKYYEFNSGTVVTATQYVGSKQDLNSNRKKNGLILKSALETIIGSVIWIGSNIFKINGVSDKSRVVVTLFDSIVEDDGTERDKDKADVKDGLMMAWEYRVKWYGETEEQAKAILGVVNNNLQE